jgi:hypothetical protein
MDIASILLSILLVALVGAFVARPLLVRAAPPARRASPADELTADYDAVLVALRDLDFDHTTGKVAAEDYEPQRAALTGRGVALLKQIDAAQAAPRLATSSDEDELEAAIRARRSPKAAPPSATSSGEDELEAAIRARRAPKAAASVAGFCPKCGAPRLADDRFCAKCGTTLASLAETAS